MSSAAALTYRDSAGNRDPGLCVSTAVQRGSGVVPPMRTESPRGQSLPLGSTRTCAQGSSAGSDDPTQPPVSDSHQQWVPAEGTSRARCVFFLLKSLLRIFFHYLVWLFEPTYASSNYSFTCGVKNHLLLFRPCYLLSVFGACLFL